MKFLKYIFSLSILLISLNLCAQQGQQFHTSNTNIDYEFESGTLNITTRLYTDAIEMAINEKTTNKSSFDNKLKNYISNKVNINVNNKPINVSYIGFQTNGNTTRIYIKADKINEINSLDIKLALLMDVYDDQQNFINLNIKNNRKKLVIRKESEVIKVTF